MVFGGENSGFLEAVVEIYGFFRNFLSDEDVSMVHKLLDFI